MSTPATHMSSVLTSNREHTHTCESQTVVHPSNMLQILNPSYTSANKHTFPTHSPFIARTNFAIHRPTSELTRRIAYRGNHSNDEGPQCVVLRPDDPSHTLAGSCPPSFSLCSLLSLRCAITCEYTHSDGRDGHSHTHNHNKHSYPYSR